MMINIFRLSCFLFIAVLFNGCSETEIIVPKAGEIISDRVVLIEDFTGVKCPNCPNAAREITSLMGRYPKNVVAVAYHTEFLDPRSQNLLSTKVNMISELRMEKLLKGKWDSIWVNLL